METDVRKVDLVIAIGRARPGAEYHRLSDRDSGLTVDEFVGEWRGPGERPTDQVALDAWNDHLDNQEAERDQTARAKFQKALDDGEEWATMALAIVQEVADLLPTVSRAELRRRVVDRFVRLNRG